MKQQTAVEWFWRWINDNQEATIKQGNQAFEKAKAMEKEQIIKAWWNGENDSSIDPKLIKDMAEQYYNETYQHSSNT